jgi:4-coumarate--CoA ligase
MANSPLADSYDLSSLKWTRSAAAPLGKELVAKAKARYGSDLVMSQGYGAYHGTPPVAVLDIAFRLAVRLVIGLTESTAVAACQTVMESEKFPGSTGRLYPTLEARLLDPDLKDVADGQPGELCLRGPTVMK